MQLVLGLIEVLYLQVCPHKTIGYTSFQYPFLCSVCRHIFLELGVNRSNVVKQPAHLFKSAQVFD